MLEGSQRFAREGLIKVVESGSNKGKQKPWRGGTS